MQQLDCRQQRGRGLEIDPRDKPVDLAHRSVCIGFKSRQFMKIVCLRGSDQQLKTVGSLPLQLIERKHRQRHLTELVDPSLLLGTVTEF